LIFSSYFRTDIGVGQDSILSPIISTLYIALIFHIFEKRTKNILHNISISTLSFVDDGLFISQEKSFNKSDINFLYLQTIWSCYQTWKIRDFSLF